MADEKYKSIPIDIVIFHKLASMYGWTWQEYRKTPYPVIKDLLKLIELLESDQEAFLCPEEVSGFKNLLRRFGSKK